MDGLGEGGNAFRLRAFNLDLYRSPDPRWEGRIQVQQKLGFLVRQAGLLKPE